MISIKIAKCSYFYNATELEFQLFQTELFSQKCKSSNLYTTAVI